MTHENELIELLGGAEKEVQDNGILEQQRASIEKVFRDFGLQGKIIRAYSAPQVNCFEFAPGAGEKLFKYETIRAKIKMALTESSGVWMLLPVPGTNKCRLEVPKAQRSFVLAGDLFRSQEWRDSQATLPLMLGKALDGENIILDLAKAPHLLIAGTTGSGKTVLLDQCLLSLMLRHNPDDLKLVLFDPMVVEFQKYKDLPYLQFPVINALEDMLCALEWLKEEMNRRYKVLAKAGCRNIGTLNEQKPGSLPYIVVIFDELADLMLIGKGQVASLLSQVCAKSRAVGIHFIISTPRPDPQVLPNIIKVNFPTRIAFKTAEKSASELILGIDDAKDLLVFGDMFFMGLGVEEIKRIQVSYADDNETARILEHVKFVCGDMKPNALPHPHCAGRNQIDALHDKLCDIVLNVLEDELDWLKDNIIDDTSNALADALIENWDELQLQKNPYQINEEANEDSKLLLKAIQIVIESRRPTISHIQRMLGIGYNKACDIMEELEEYGIVSPQQGNEMRSVLVDTYEEAVSRLPKQN